MRSVQIADIKVGPGQALTIFCGPCVIESATHTLQAAERLAQIFSSFPVNFVFKSSYDKANRSAIESFRGPGLEEGLRILEQVRHETGLPLLTDVHSPEEARAAAEVVDLLQIPAFLCRQTDLLTAAAKSGRPLLIKKGQFMAPWDMQHVVGKVEAFGQHQIILCDRGTSFGYNNLVSDFRAIPVMQDMGYPVCFDATHSVQLPGGQGSHSGGQREFIPTLAKAAIAAGANCLFMEAHPEPSKAKSDAASVLDFQQIPALMEILLRLYNAVQESSMSAGATL
jgi:2-dehydro-3-deoxyphosphooctonate aldolase (KDO 8-P synthase)